LQANVHENDNRKSIFFRRSMLTALGGSIHG
jgi:hypothetical protein